MGPAVRQADASISIVDNAPHRINADGKITGRQATDEDCRVRGLRTFVMYILSKRLTGKRWQWQDILA